MMMMMMIVQLLKETNEKVNKRNEKAVEMNKKVGLLALH